MGHWPGWLPLPPRLQRAHIRADRQPPNLYLREDHLLAPLPTRLAAFDPAGAMQHMENTETDDAAEIVRARRLLLVCDRTSWIIEPNGCSLARITGKELRGEAGIMG